jgi:D-alanyl-lipoteichoic acid acyltransferase DltB (MBOAT superfamily)
MPRRPEWTHLGPGLALLTWGLFEKIVLADGLFAPVADASFAATSSIGSGAAWAGALAFSGQIFCDFAGYSCCAIGAARCLGFTLPDNFRNPYAARGLSDFWRRWHISLSTWLRDYLYVSLGGNRAGRWRTYRNLMLTMLLGGLWHGAAWSFVLWGGLHGVGLVLERALRERFALDLSQLRGAAAMATSLVTLFIVVLAWVPFRAESLAGALDLLRLMLTPGDWSLNLDQQFALLGFALVVLAQHLFRDQPLQSLWMRLPTVLLGLLLALLLSAIVLSPGETHAFIYFQF